MVPGFEFSLQLSDLGAISCTMRITWSYCDEAVQASE